MPKKSVLTEEERRQHQREAMKRWREKQKAKPKPQKPQKSLFPQSEQNEPLPGEADPAVTAAQINERYHFSVIIGEYKRGRKTVIAERIGGKAAPDIEKRYRLKTTVYEFFSTEGELQRYCLKNKIPLETNRR